MDLDVGLSEHLEGLREALAAFTDEARRAGLDAPVPTTPGWDVRHLVAHQGMVHRWAIGRIAGERVDTRAIENEALALEDPVTWLREGGLRLVTAIQEAPEDLETPVFLDDAPSPRRFWARRQCHETTIHSVDALAAALGRMPRAEDTWITRKMALDGIDELLTGFLSRKSSPLRTEKPVVFGIHPTDVERSWLVHVSAEPPVVERLDEGAPGRWHRHGRADVVLKAPAEVLYLALWNRTDELTAEGLELWRELARVTWT